MVDVNETQPLGCSLPSAFPNDRNPNPRKPNPFITEPIPTPNRISPFARNPRNPQLTTFVKSQNSEPHSKTKSLIPIPNQKTLIHLLKPQILITGALILNSQNFPQPSHFSTMTWIMNPFSPYATNC